MHKSHCEYDRGTKILVIDGKRVAFSDTFLNHDRGNFVQMRISCFTIWYGHVLRRDDDSVLRVALNLEVSGKRK